jgi:hypothetical protein
MYFPTSYEDSRQHFIGACVKSSIPVRQIPISDSGFFLDIAELGPQDSENLLLHVSGTHGIEGYAGAAIQHALLASDILQQSKVSISLVHVLSPWGMHEGRKVNAENIDLNRNFLFNAEAFRGCPEAYAKLYTFINPQKIGPLDCFLPKAAYYIARYGFAALKQAIAGGQYEYAQGLFWGGKKLAPESQAFINYCREKAKGRKRVGLIDVHTGLGSFGQESLLVDAQLSQASQNVLRNHLGSHVQISTSDTSVAYTTSGGLAEAIPTLFPNAEVLPLVQEFGTYSNIKVFELMRKENCWHHHGAAVDGVERERGKEAFKIIFCPPDSAWQTKVVTDGVGLVKKMLSLLSTQQ